MKLKAGFVTHAAAKYAVKAWHYSKKLPVGKKVIIGFFEDDTLIGVVIFSQGANNNLLKPYGLSQIEGCELSRVALSQHKTPVTKVIKIAIALLKKKCPGLRLIVSFADSNQGHVGTIYQAGNWIFTGMTGCDYEYHYKGRAYHKRQVSVSGFNKQFGALKRSPKVEDCKKIRLGPKLRYLMPLDKKMRKQILSIAKLYIKSVPDKH